MHEQWGFVIATIQAKTRDWKDDEGEKNGITDDTNVMNRGTVVINNIT